VKLNRRQAYFALLAATALVCLLYQSVWIFSRTTNARIDSVFVNTGKGNGISWIDASYLVGNHLYYGSYLRNDRNINDRALRVRYLIFDPALSRSDSFVSNWGPLIMFFLVVFLILSILLVRKDIISDRATFLFRARWPFITVKNNDVEDYDEHDIVVEKPDKAEQALKLKLQAEESQIPEGGIQASVYKNNPNAVGIIVVYAFFFFWFFYHILSSSMGVSGIFIFGSVLIFVPLYVQNTDNPVFKMKIPSENSLAFSSGGIAFKEDVYELEYIEAAVVYLEAFRGFEYRDRVTAGNINTISAGDNNKISFRYKSEVIDFTFILNDSSDYWAFKNLMSSWALKGVNVILEKVFEDDFVIQEMIQFSPPVLQSPG
jgi:hypothetical protein